MRILYVDLTPDSIPGRTDEVLRSRGHTLFYISTCSDALEMIHNQCFDSVVITQDSLEVLDFIAKAHAIQGELPLFVTYDWSVAELPWHWSGAEDSRKPETLSIDKRLFLVCARIRLSRTDRASASNRARAIPAARSTPLSNSRCRSRNASLVPANCTGPHPYRVLKEPGSFLQCLLFRLQR